MANAPLPHFEDLDPSGRYGRPGGDTIRIAVLGDSSVTGPGLGHGSQVWIAQLAARLPWRVELNSLARGGSRVRDVLLHQAPAAVRERPDLFIVSVGANDVLHATPTRQFTRDLEALLEVLGASAPVVSLGIGDLSAIPRLPPTLRPLVSLRSATIDRLHGAATAHRDRVIRVPVAELSDPHFRRVGHSLFAADLFHPNHRGHALWAELFEPFVLGALDPGALRPMIDLTRAAVPLSAAPAPSAPSRPVVLAAP